MHGMSCVKDGARAPALLCGSSAACSIIGFYARQFTFRPHFSARRWPSDTNRRSVDSYTFTCFHLHVLVDKTYVYRLVDLSVTFRSAQYPAVD